MVKCGRMNFAKHNIHVTSFLTFIFRRGTLALSGSQMDLVLIIHYNMPEEILDEFN